MKKILHVLVLVLVVALTSCENFFDITNPKTLSTDNFPATMEQVDLLVTAAYAQDHAIGTYAFYWFPMGVYLYDHTTDIYGSYDERATSQDNYTAIDSRYTTSSFTDICKWAKLATTGIEGVAFFRSHYATRADSAALAFAEGQCYFNRAMAYWHAQIFFEMDADALGFPIIDRVISNVEELKLARATVKETWLFAIADAKKAVELLSGHQEKFRADEWAAKGLLAKIYMQSLYLFPENKQVCKELLEDIILHSGKQLVPSEVYRDMFYGNELNEHNAESLYELTMTCNPNQDGPWENYTTGSGMPMVFAPWYVDLDIRFRKGREDVTDPLTLEHDVIISTKSSQWGNNFIHDRNIARFGFADFYGDTVPRLTFNPDYDFNAPRSQENFPYMLVEQNYRTDALTLKNNPEKVDPRLMLCAGQPYVDNYMDAKGRTTWYDRSSECNNLPERLAWQHRKFTNNHGVEMGGGEFGLGQSSAANIYLIRLADIYLLYAELMAEDNPAVALEYVNKVHRRAYGYDPESACPYDYTSLNDRTHAFYAEDPLANNPLRYERWAELFAEGQWWMDIRRFRCGQEEADYYQKTSHGPITWKGDCSYVQPIPQLELERNRNMKQSEGYAGI